MPLTPETRDAAPTLATEMRAKAFEASRLLKLLANEARLMVLCHLVAGELPVAEINARVPLSQSALSQHLARLRSEGLVATRREGHSIFYRLADEQATRLLQMLHDLYCSEARAEAS